MHDIPTLYHYIYICSYCWTIHYTDECDDESVGKVNERDNCVQLFESCRYTTEGNRRDRWTFHSPPHPPPTSTTVDTKIYLLYDCIKTSAQILRGRIGPRRVSCRVKTQWTAKILGRLRRNEAADSKTS